MHIIGEASNGRNAIKLCSKLCPDVIVIDVAMPEMNGIHGTPKFIKKESPLNPLWVA